MNDTEFRSLREGDIVRHKSKGSRPYIVTGNYGGRLTAVRSVDLNNPIEWELVPKNPDFVVENRRTGEWYQSEILTSSGPRPVGLFVSSKEGAQATAAGMNSKVGDDIWFAKKRPVSGQ